MRREWRRISVFYPVFLRALLLGLMICGTFHFFPGVVQARQDALDLDGLWTRQETLLSLGVVGAAGLASLWDEDARRRVSKNRNSTLDDLSDGFDLIGHPLTGLSVSALMWTAGTWRDDHALAQTGQLAFEAVFLSQAATAVVKVGFGRHRPDEDDDAWSFNPMSFSDQRHSLSSAHTANAFALAGVLSRRSERSWAPWVYYGMAALVGASRVYDDEHWLSDVMVGALIGDLAARATFRFHQNNPGFFVVPGSVGSDGAGLRFNARW